MGGFGGGPGGNSDENSGFPSPGAESSLYTTNFYRDTPPMCIAMLLRRSIRVRGCLNTPNFKLPEPLKMSLQMLLPAHKVRQAAHLSVRCGCDSDTDSNRAMPTARKTSKTQTLRNTGPFFFPHFYLLQVVGSKELA